MEPKEISPPLKEVIEAMPEPKLVRLRGLDADFYGASWEIARSLGLRYPPRSFASWIHGWVHGERVYPEHVALGNNRKQRILVANRDIESFLRKHGYENVFTSGLPILYTRSLTPARLPRSLLIMPVHTLEKGSQRWDEEEYVQEILKLTADFEYILACVYGSCVKQGAWIQTFEKHSIPWVTGAMVNDGNSLRRIRYLLESFETMTTNSIGSHVAYGNYVGTRVAIYGPYAEFDRAGLEKDPFFMKNPHFLELKLKQDSESNLRRLYPEFFTHPSMANLKQEWARQELGEPAKRTPEEVAELLGWTLLGQVTGYPRWLCSVPAKLWERYVLDLHHT